MEIILNTTWIFFISIGLIILVISYFQKDKQSQNLQNQLKVAKSESQQKIAELKLEYQTWALLELDKFKQAEIDKIYEVAKKNAIENAAVLLQKWKIEGEAAIRQDAINRSYSVNLGKITEHLLPYHESFLSQFNPKDARFIGSPIDLIVFDGYADKRDDIIIYMVEIKTGNSKLSETQKKIKQSVLDGNIRWAEINPKDFELTADEKKENILDDFLKIIIAISPLNNIADYHSFADTFAENMKIAVRLIHEDGYNRDEAIEQQINKLNLIFNSADERKRFKRIVEAIIS